MSMIGDPLRRPAAGRGRRRGRGFTLLELVLVGAISSVLFLLLIRWVLTLGAASSVTMDNASAQRSADVARSAFNADVDAAKVCAPGESSPIRAVAPDHVTFTVADPSTTGTDAVTWAATRTGSTWSLTRTVAAATGADPCAANGTPATTTYAEHIAAVQTDQILAGSTVDRPAFYTLTAGQPSTDPTQAWGDCTTHESADRCYAGGVGVNWLLISPVDGSAPIAVARSFTFSATSQGLS